MKLYALHDKKANALSSFHVEKSDAVASRGFAEAVSQSNSVFGKYPDDFELVAIAEVNDSTVERWDNVVPVLAVDGKRYEVILTARQIVDLRGGGDTQLSLIKEA